MGKFDGLDNNDPGCNLRGKAARFLTQYGCACPCCASQFRWRHRFSAASELLRHPFCNFFASLRCSGPRVWAARP
eukprot:526574-Pyramimonas_sp.AAC.1